MGGSLGDGNRDVPRPKTTIIIRPFFVDSDKDVVSIKDGIHG